MLDVDGVELLVDGAQLLVRGLQLLVRGDELLVGGLQLLVRGLELFDRGLQLAARQFEVPLERIHIVGRDDARRFRSRGVLRRGRRERVDLHEHAGGPGALRGDGRDEDAPALGAVVARVAQVHGMRGREVVPETFEQAFDGVLEPAFEQRGQRGRDAAALERQEALGAAEAVQQLMRAVEQERHRHEAVEQRLVELGRRALRTRYDCGRRAPPRGDARRGGRGDETQVAALRKHARLGVHVLELVVERAERLGRTEEQQAARAQAEVQQREHARLCGGLEVDEHVSAADEVELRERGVADDVVRREDHHLAQGLADPDLRAFRNEVALAPLGGHGGERLCRVDACGSVLQRLLVDVGREDPDAACPVRRAAALVEQDRERVDLLARRTARDPGTHFLAGAFLEQLRTDRRLEALERFGIPEELGHADEQVVVEALRFLCVGLDEGRVALEARYPREFHAAADAAREGRGLIDREVHLVARGQRLEHAPYARILDRSLGGRLLASADERQHARELGRHGLGPQHQVRGARCGGAARHPVELRVLGALHEHGAAGRLHGPHSARAVAARPRKNQRDGAGTGLLSQRAQKRIDRQAGCVARVLVRQEQLAAGEDHLLFRGNYIDVIGLERRVVGGLRDRQRRYPSEELRHMALELGGQMLKHHVGRAEVIGKPGEHLLERGQAARRGADRDDRKKSLCGSRV